MKYLLLVYHNKDRFQRMPEDTRKDMLAESIPLCHQLANKGQYVHASPLQPEATGTIVRVQDGKPMITDGTFMERKEQLAGYFLIDAKDRAEAVRIGTQVPGARIGTVEVRPVIAISVLPDIVKRISSKLRTQN